MDNIANVYDLLNQDAEFARQVSDIHRSASAALKATGDLEKRVDSQKELYEDMQKKASELTDLVSRLEGQLMDLRKEREALQEDIRRHEGILEEMQRLEESFNGALTAYGNIANVYSIFDNRLKEMEGKIVVQPQAPEAQPEKKPERKTVTTPSAPAKVFVPFKNVDYSEVTSVEKLFKKYSGKIDGPVVVIRTKTYPWNGDYCMAIRSVSKGKAWGIRYSYGEPGKKNPLNASDEEYSMYNGENYWKIAEDFKNQTEK